MKAKALLISAGVASATQERWKNATYRYNRLHFPINGEAIYHDVSGDKLLEVGNVYLLVNSTATDLELPQNEQYYHMYIDFRAVPPLMNREPLKIALKDDHYLSHLLLALQSLLQSQPNQKLSKSGKFGENQNEETYSQAQQLLRVVLGHLCSQYGLQTMSNPKIETALKYMEENYADYITNEDIAEKLHVDIRYFVRLFKKYVGVSPHQYLTQVRIEHSIEELRQDHSVTETAQLCGYQNENSFRDAFKRVTGYSPTAFLNNGKEK